MHAKEQLFRTLDDVNPDPRLAELEASIMGEVNKLGIGTMGFGGRVSLIGCKIGVQNRLPASFFVSVAYDCWAFRRLGVVLDAKTGGITRWLLSRSGKPGDRDGRPGGVPAHRARGRRSAVAPLRRAGAIAEGRRRRARLRAAHTRDGTPCHAHLMKHDPPVDLRGAVLYHCGPVVVKEGDGWQ